VTFEIFYDLIFGKRCFASVFELRTVSNVDATDPATSKKFQFSQNFGMVNFGKKESDIVPFACTKQSYRYLWLMFICPVLKCENGV